MYSARVGQTMIPKKTPENLVEREIQLEGSRRQCTQCYRTGETNH